MSRFVTPWLFIGFFFWHFRGLMRHVNKALIHTHVPPKSWQMSTWRQEIIHPSCCSTPHTKMCLSCSRKALKKYPILQIVLFNFPVLQSLTLVKLPPLLNPHNPQKPRRSSHPHPSFGKRLVQPQRNRGSDPDAGCRVDTWFPDPHHEPQREFITY